MSSEVRCFGCAVGLLVALSILGSCSSRSFKPGYVSLADLASLNQGRLVNVSLGMAKDQVVAVMGTEKAETHDGVVHNPWTVEAFTGGNGNQYEVLYYVTRPNQPFTPVRKTLTTPIVLKDGRVVGWGDDALEQASK